MPLVDPDVAADVALKAFRARVAADYASDPGMIRVFEMFESPVRAYYHAVYTQLNRRPSSPASRQPHATSSRVVRVHH